jgi:hypothetical protein
MEVFLWPTTEIAGGILLGFWIVLVARHWLHRRRRRMRDRFGRALAELYTDRSDARTNGMLMLASIAKTRPSAFIRVTHELIQFVKLRAANRMYGPAADRVRADFEIRTALNTISGVIEASPAFQRRLRATANPGRQLAGPLVDAREIDFSGVDLTGVRFTGLDLTRTSFAGADLSEASFTAVNLRFANFGHAVLNSAVFTRVDFSWSTLRDVDATGVRFDQCRTEPRQAGA